MAKAMKIADDQYEIIDMGSEEFQHILLNDLSPFPSVIFQFGKTQLVEDDDQLRVKFEYEVFSNENNHNTDSMKFREYIGQILVQNLEEILIYNKYAKLESSK